MAPRQRGPSTRICAYCGKSGKPLSRDHVVPKCLYPASRHGSRIPRITVPACKECNGGWSDDEAHFRNIIMIAGDPNPAVRELWDGKAVPSFEHPDGRRRLADLFMQMVPVQVDGGPRYMVFPANDERVMRIVRKVVRGLCHFHGFLPPVGDHRVRCDVLRFEVPEEMLSAMHYSHSEEDIFRYRYALLDDAALHSCWLLTFFQRTHFIAGIVAEQAQSDQPQ